MHLTFTMEKVHGAHDSQRQIEKGRPVGIVRLQKVTPILLHGKIQSIVQSMISTTEIEGGAYSLQPNSTHNGSSYKVGHLIRRPLPTAWGSTSEKQLPAAWVLFLVHLQAIGRSKTQEKEANQRRKLQSKQDMGKERSKQQEKVLERFAVSHAPTKAAGC